MLGLMSPVGILKIHSTHTHKHLRTLGHTHTQPGIPTHTHTHCAHPCSSAHTLAHPCIPTHTRTHPTHTRSKPELNYHMKLYINRPNTKRGKKEEDRKKEGPRVR